MRIKFLVHERVFHLKNITHSNLYPFISHSFKAFIFHNVQLRSFIKFLLQSIEFLKDLQYEFQSLFKAVLMKVSIMGFDMGQVY